MIKYNKIISFIKCTIFVSLLPMILCLQPVNGMQSYIPFKISRDFCLVAGGIIGGIVIHTLYITYCSIDNKQTTKPINQSVTPMVAQHLKDAKKMRQTIMIEVQAAFRNTDMPLSQTVSIVKDFITLQRSYYDTFQTLKTEDQNHIKTDTLNTMNEDYAPICKIKEILIHKPPIYFQAIDMNNRKEIVPLNIIMPLINKAAAKNTV